MNINKFKGKKIYLAIPYRGWEEYSFKVANRVAVYLINQGILVFSPITHSHPLSIHENIPGDWDFWSKYDYSFIKDWADELWYIQANNDVNKKHLEMSEGVRAEVDFAVEIGKSVKRFVESTMEVKYPDNVFEEELTKRIYYYD